MITGKPFINLGTYKTRPFLRKKFCHAYVQPISTKPKPYPLLQLKHHNSLNLSDTYKLTDETSIGLLLSILGYLLGYFNTTSFFIGVQFVPLSLQ